MDKIKFWVAIGKVKQMTFDDFGKPTKAHEIDAPVREQHIVFNEVLMCGRSRSVLKKKGEKHSVRLNSFKNVPLCKDCEEKFKSRPELSWQKWASQTETMDSVPRFQYIIGRPSPSEPTALIAFKKLIDGDKDAEPTISTTA